MDRTTGQQRRRHVEPRVARGWSYSLLRAFTTIISRDVSVRGVINDMCEGFTAIYVDFLGYDEVSHHSGPERFDTLTVLRDLDRQVARIGRATQWTPRPCKVVVLSDHGQTQGATFQQRTGETLAERGCAHLTSRHIALQRTGRPGVGYGRRAMRGLTT
ncbi:MAG: alkaline phosphatase family protein [Ilumatobacteraceae bacterium]